MSKHIKRKTRQSRIRNKVFGTEVKPRLNVFRSNSHIYAQLIDDISAKTLVSASTAKIKNPSGEKSKKINAAFIVGQEIAKKAVAKKIKNAVFDRAGYKYHGRVKAVAEGAREGGLAF